jgi:hypothetical protein
MWSTGCSTSPAMASKRRTNGSNKRRHGGPVLPERGRRAVDVAGQRADPAAVEGVRALDLGVPPPQALGFESETRQERRRYGERMEGGTHVVDKSRQGQLSTARAPADLLVGLDEVNTKAFARDGDGCCEAVRTGPDDDRVDHAVDPAAFFGVSAATASGRAAGGDPSHGWRARRPLMSTHPCSTSPVAASQMA